MRWGRRHELVKVADVISHMYDVAVLFMMCSKSGAMFQHEYCRILVMSRKMLQHEHLVDLEKSLLFLPYRLEISLLSSKSFHGRVLTSESKSLFVRLFGEELGTGS